jgi:hypothetical protein
MSLRGHIMRNEKKYMMIRLKDLDIGKSRLLVYMFQWFEKIIKGILNCDVFPHIPREYKKNAHNWRSF